MVSQEAVEQYQQFLRELAASRHVGDDEMETALAMVGANCALCVFHFPDSVTCGAFYDRTSMIDPSKPCEDYSDQPGSGIPIEMVGEYLNANMRPTDYN